MDSRTEGNSKPFFCIDIFNRRCLDAGWPVLCDPGCRFTDRKLSGVLTLWQNMAVSGIPYRKDMTARLLQPYIPQLAIFERVAGDDGHSRIKTRLMGTNMVTFTMEMSGRFLDEVIAPEFLPRWVETAELVLRFGGPVRILHRGDTFKKKHIIGEGFAAPLLTNDGKTNLIMAVTSYEGFDTWETVSAQAKLQLGL